MSRAVQVFMLGVLFVFVAAGCVAFLVLSGGVDPTGSRIIFVAGALVLLSGLSAAVSALGPKYRPSPFLTPLTAGVFAALVATTAVVSAGHSQNTTKGKAPAARVADRRVPPATPAKPKAPEAPLVQTAVAQPAVIAPPVPPPQQQKPVRVLDGSLDPAAVQAAAAAPKVDPAPAPKPVALAAPEPAPPAAAAKAPTAETKVAAVQEPAKAAAPAAAPEAASTAAKKPVAVAAIPSPKPAPPLPAADSGAPISLQTGFDTTTPASKSAGQPLSLAAAASQSGQTAAATPPLPRIRPCGAGGPACP